MNNIIILLGPTASGKSDLSQRLANDFPFEIINADLYSIYKGLDIGTAKPSKKALRLYKHHLVNDLDPHLEYNVSKYCHDVDTCIKEIISQDKIPLITGGSMMYVYQLLHGLSYHYNTCDSDLKLLRYILKEYSNKQIIDSINKYDYSLVKTLNINDTYRIEKLLERLISSDSTQSNSNGLYKNTSLKISVVFINIKDREYLRENIKKRTLNMIENGLIDEVKNLRDNMKLSHHHQSMRAIGYRETLQYLKSEITFKELIDKITVSTQQLAKRQITWMNKFNIDFYYQYPDDSYNKLSDFVRNLLN